MCDQVCMYMIIYACLVKHDNPAKDKTLEPGFCIAPEKVTKSPNLIKNTHGSQLQCSWQSCPAVSHISYLTTSEASKTHRSKKKLAEGTSWVAGTVKSHINGIVFGNISWRAPMNLANLGNWQKSETRYTHSENALCSVKFPINIIAQSKWTQHCTHTIIIDRLLSVNL